MKKRRSLLFGLGILTALSVTIPTAAAEVEKEANSRISVVGIQKNDVENKDWDQAQSSTENGTDKENGQAQKKLIYQIKENTYQVMVWNEKKASYEEATSTGVFELEFEEEIGAHTYFLKEGKICSGLQKVRAEEVRNNDGFKEPDSKLEDGSYFFYDNGGKEDAPRYLFLPEKDSWNEDKSQGWYYVYTNGRIEQEKKNGWQEFESGKWIYVEEGLGNVWSGWVKKDEDQWWYLEEDGSRSTGADKQGMQTISYQGQEMTYFLNGDGKIQKGFQTADGKTYYFDETTGELQKYIGWKKIDGKIYYFNKDFQMETINGWQLIEGNWYWFENGTLGTDWRLVNGKWYYMNPSDGAMQTGFFKDRGGRLFHSDENGAMTGGGWNLINGTWYWMNQDGVIWQGWLNLGKTWYYMNENGAMQTGWILPDGKTWYYMNENGDMAEGWKNLRGTWYYLTPGNGAMKTGWYKVNGTWYYSRNDGDMASNTWVDTYYYVNGNGAMVNNTWVGKKYVGADGAYLRNCWQKLSGKRYYFDSNGVRATGWRYIGGYKYYFNSDGTLIQDLDSVIGIQPSYEITVNRVKCQVTVYAKDGKNGYIIPVKTFACSVGLPNTPTPTGTFYTPIKYRWHTLMGPSYGQYCTRIYGGILFHSVAGANMTSYNLSAVEYNKLGQPASHGCVRLNVRDAKGIYDNCKLGTKVTISDSVGTPFDKPSTLKIPASQNWDPTDPNI